MALKECPERGCNQMVSSSADKCPLCGFNLKKQRSDNMYMKQILLIVISAFIIAGLSHFGYLDGVMEILKDKIQNSNKF